MSNKNSQIILEDNRNDFSFKINKSNINISFNRVSFIFFIFFIIFIIFSIHLVHLGSRDSKKVINENLTSTSNKLYRADIIDRNGKYLSKTVSSIDIGISTRKVIDKKKLLINLKYIFPNEDFVKIQNQIKNFFT